MSSKAYRFTLTILGIAFLAVLYILGMSFFERVPLKYTNLPFPVSEQKVYKPGDTLRLLVERCVNRPLTYVLTQSFVSDNPNATVKVYYLESHEITTDELGCITVLGIPKTIPKVLPTGSYHIEHGIFTKGKFKDFLFNVKSQSFEIENNEPEPIVIVPISTPIKPNKKSQTVTTTTTDVSTTTNTVNNTTTNNTTTNNTTTNNTTTNTETPKPEDKPPFQKILDTLIDTL